MIVENTKKYIKEQKELLDSGKVQEVNLVGVWLKLIEHYFGDSDNIDFNGWQGDYWFSNEQYEVYGCMYNATATIRIKGESSAD